VKILVSVLCDKATVREGLLHILGGGVTLLGRPQLPARLSVDLALMLQLENASEFEQPHTVNVLLRDSNDELILAGELFFDAPLPDEMPDPLPGLPLVIPLQDVPARNYGAHTIAIMMDGQPLTDIRFMVEKQINPGVTENLEPSHID